MWNVCQVIFRHTTVTKLAAHNEACVNRSCAWWTLIGGISRDCGLVTPWSCDTLVLCLPGINLNRFQIRINSFWAYEFGPFLRLPPSRPHACPLEAHFTPLPEQFGSLEVALLFLLLHLVFLFKITTIPKNRDNEESRYAKTFGYELPLKSYGRKEKRWPT